MKKGIVITCVDPRLHELPVKLAPLLEVDEVYAFRIAGPDGVALRPELGHEWRGLISGAKRLLGLAPITAVAVAGHTTCAGHDGDDQCHFDDTLAAAKRLREAGIVPEEVPVHAFVAVRGESDQVWNIKKLGTL